MSDDLINWLLMGTQVPDFDLRLRAYDEIMSERGLVRVKDAEITRLREQLADMGRENNLLKYGPPHIGMSLERIMSDDLHEQLAEAERQRDAEYERAESQAALVNCACCHDEPTDLCEAHKRVLDRLVADQRDAAQAEALEKAAKVCDEVAGNTKDFDRDHRRAAGQCGAAIRSLIKEDRT